jgi:hypothetical protein
MDKEIDRPTEKGYGGMATVCIVESFLKGKRISQLPNKRVVVAAGKDTLRPIAGLRITSVTGICLTREYA